MYEYTNFKFKIISTILFLNKKYYKKTINLTTKYLVNIQMLT